MNDNEQQMTSTDERWSADDGGNERFSLWADGTLASEHLDCGVHLDADQLRALSAAASDVANEHTATVSSGQTRDREWLLGAGEGLGFAAGWPSDAAEFAARWNLWGSEYRDKHVRRFVEYAERHIRNLEQAPGLVIENGWIAQVVDSCTCGNGDAYPYGHQPGCGLEPIATVESALVALATIGTMTTSTFWTAEFPDPAGGVGTIVVGSSVSAEHALEQARQQPGAPGANAIKVTEQVTRTVVTTSEVQA
jgi:hypothetical protein